MLPESTLIELIERSELHDPPVARALRELQSRNKQLEKSYGYCNKKITTYIDIGNEREVKIAELQTVVNRIASGKSFKEPLVTSLGYMFDDMIPEDRRAIIEYAAKHSSHD